MWSGRWLTENQHNGIFGGSLTYNVEPGHSFFPVFLTLQLLCMYIMTFFKNESSVYAIICISMSIYIFVLFLVFLASVLTIF